MHGAAVRFRATAFSVGPHGGPLSLRFEDLPPAEATLRVLTPASRPPGRRRGCLLADLALDVLSRAPAATRCHVRRPGRRLRASRLPRVGLHALETSEVSHRRALLQAERLKRRQAHGHDPHPPQNLGRRGTGPVPGTTRQVIETWRRSIPALGPTARRKGVRHFVNIYIGDEDASSTGSRRSSSGTEVTSSRHRGRLTPGTKRRYHARRRPLRASVGCARSATRTSAPARRERLDPWWRGSRGRLVYLHRAGVGSVSIDALSRPEAFVHAADFDLRPLGAAATAWRALRTICAIVGRRRGGALVIRFARSRRWPPFWRRSYPLLKLERIAPRAPPASRST